MFENLTNKLEGILSKLKKAPSLNEDQVETGLKEIRQALLAADVALPVVKKFIEDIKPKAIGQEIIRSTSPGQMLVKIVYDQLVEVLGGKVEEINLKAVPPASILLVGLQGSGKTTSLYAGLKEISDRSQNILTIEDPVEYALEGIGQTQVNNKVGMTFAAGLRAILRQDPDVVMVGEIRDKETAEIAIQASLTGHLVLSTIHTNDTLGAITRLIDMGVEPYLLASSLRTIISQRLVRKLSSDGETYSGRQGIFEILDIDQNVKELINDDFSEKKVRDIIDPQHDFLEESGQKLIQEGVTTLEEVRRVLMEA